MNKLKEEQGITLVALIITIVVLLILAIVSIGAVSDSNIIAYAQNAAQDYNTAKEEQEVLLREYETEIEKHLPNNNITKVGVKAYNFVVNKRYLKVRKIKCLKCLWEYTHTHKVI